jgi:GxxExxY protein
VYRELGAGFLEQVYEAALMKEFLLQDISATKQVSFDVMYKKSVVGKYIADIVVENKVILELKAQEKISGAHEAQLINYLNASGLRVGLLVNFCYPKAVIKRIVN